jgi:hypothetical protein
MTLVGRVQERVNELTADVIRVPRRVLADAPGWCFNWPDGEANMSGRGQEGVHLHLADLRLRQLKLSGRRSNLLLNQAIGRLS